ncbi:hypothetical protein [Nocardioides sp. YIM 152588]|uniref:hypothetical protein n=1 Tax=Nocardioides sp. YIM 152588 TaxID=3158259 RepID=UPI0032E5181E
MACSCQLIDVPDTGRNTVDLDILGLTADESDAYRALTAAAEMDPATLAHALGTTTAAATTVLTQLEGQGLAARRVDDADSFVAARPSVALGSLLAQRQVALKEAEAAVARLEDGFNAVRHGQSPVEIIDVVLGHQALAARLEQIQSTARHEVLSLVKAPVAVVGSLENTAEDRAVARGVQYRAVLERSMLAEEPHLYDEIRRVQAFGEEIRLAPSVPMKLFVIDREVALVPLALGDSPVEGALLVRKSGLLEALVALWQFVWNAAFPVAPTAAGDRDVDALPAAEDLQVLTLQLAGLTDQQVAKDLRVSVRTVQRRLRGLMEVAGVETRLQLGVVAAERGWVSRAERS